MGRLGALRRRFTGERVGAPKRSIAALASLSLVAGLLTTGAVVAVGDAPRAEAAPSPTQQWVTSVSGVTGSGVGAARTLAFQSGVTATETTTAVTGTCVPFGTGAAMSGVSQFLEPDPPAEVRAANSNCAGPTSGSNSRTSIVEFSKPVIAPVIHVANLDASRLGVTGSGVTLTQLAKNNAMEVQGTTLNATLQQALNPGCALNDGSNPNGACGSFRLTSSTPVTTFSLANDTLGSPVFGSGENDSWNYTLSYPTAPLTKEFSPASIRVGETSQLTFTIANPAAPTQPTLSPMGFTDTLPAGVTIADDTVTASEGCAAATVEATPGAGEFTASAVSVDPGETCEITVNVTSDTAGSYTNSTDNLTTTVANLVPNADTTLTVTEAPVAPTPFACTPGQPGILSQNAPADFFTVDLVTGASTEVRSDAYPFNINAIGFNPIDNFVYGDGADPAGRQIVRVASDWSVEELGLPSNWATHPGIPASWSGGGGHVGEFDAEGHYWLSNGVGWAEIDLSNPTSPTYMRVLTAGTLTMPNGWGGHADWTYNVEDGDLYTIAQNLPATTPRQFALVRFDTATRTTSVVGSPLGAMQHPNGQYAGGFGAIYSDPDGFLYGSDNFTGGIWRVDMASGSVDFFASGPASSLNDGARCFNSPLPIDFGDAPDSYGTTLAADGPRHSIPGYDGTAMTAPVMLGASIDSETDGQPSAAADGDGADEDGVTFNPALGYSSPTLRTGLDPRSQQPLQNTLEVEASADGFVSVWVDWNQDGDFLDDGERVAHAQAVTAGTNEVTFSQATNPNGISSYVRVRYSTDAASIATPTGSSPDGEVEDYRVLIERQVQPDACTADGQTYWAFTFGDPVDLTGSGGPGSSARYEGVTVVDGTAVDMVVEVVAGQMQVAGGGSLPPNGFGNGDGIPGFGDDDARWQIRSDATIRYAFYEAGTTNPVAISGVFTANDMDRSADGTIVERATFTAADLAGYGVSELSRVAIIESGDDVIFEGTQPAEGDPASRFQIVLNDVASFEARWQGGNGSGFGFDGDGDIGIQPPACSDFGDAPNSYGTDLASNGPRHTIVPGLLIGSEIDVDTDGQPTPEADGDDTNRIDDEDAFDEPVILNPGVTSATLTVPVTNTTGAAATLYGWIDANADGRFQASEFASVVVPDGATSVELAFAGMPSTVDGSQPALRLRLTSDVLVDDPATTDVDERALGAASNGEVEDHLVTVLERLVVRKSSDATADTRPGDTVTYTVTAENTGPGDYTAENPAVVFDDLSGVLDDARYNGDAEADADGALDFESPLLSWVGELGANETVTITYSVTLGSNGDGTVRNVAFAPGCDPADDDCDTTTPACDPPQNGVDPTTGLPCAETELLLPSLRHTKVADTTELPADGGVVTYTITVENTGPGAFTDVAPGSMTDDLTHVLDDAGYNGDASADRGTASFDEEAGTLSWSGALAAGEVATITYSVTYDDATGDNVLLNLACVPADLADNPADACRSVQIPGSALQDRKSVDPADGSSVVAGQEVTYTLYFENTGEADATVDTFDDLSDVLDDATLTGPPTTSDEALSAVVNGSQLDVTGTVAPGETLTVSYTVTVLPFDEQGDHVLGNVLGGDEGCAAFDPTCRTENPVRHVSVDKSSDAVEGVNTGDVVTYTVTIENDGEGDYTDAQPAVVRDDLSGVLDDATYGDDAEASAGAVSFEAPELTWRGGLAAGESVTVTYSVVVTNAGDHELENIAGAVCAEPEVCDPPVTVVTRLPHIVPSKSASPESGAGLQAGDEVTYTLSWTNDGGAAGALDSTDDLSDVLDDAEVTAEPVASSDAVTAVRDGDEIRVTGTIGAGETVTVTYTVTVKADGERGDNIAENVLTPDVPPYACAEDVADCDPFEPPTTTHPIGELEDWKTADPASGTSVVAGQEVTYTLHFENTGEADVTVDTFDDLSGVLDDAELTTEPTTSDEALSAVVDGSRIDVDGTVAPGETLTVSYTVTVLPFDEQGDHVLGNVLRGDEGCAADDTTCRTENPVRHVSVEKSSDAAEGVNTGDVVTYTVTIENDGEGDYTEAEPATVRDDLTAVLDDATYRGDASATAGEVSFEESALTWTGALAAGESVTVTYSVVVTNAGDHELENVAGAVCADPEVCDPPVTVVTRLPHIVPSKSASPESGAGLQAGDEVTYTLSWTNDGGAAGALDSTDDLSDVLDDAEVTAEPVASSEAVTAVRDGDEIRVTGTIGAGETVTVTYTVTVKADGERGDNVAENVLTPDVPPSTCAEGADDCEPFEPPTTSHPIGQLAAWKTVDPASGSTVRAGQELTYTLHFENTGEADVDVLRDDVLTSVLDDASVTAEPVSSDEALTASAIEDGRFTVTGTLAAGEQATVSYTVTVLEDGERGDDRLGNFLVPSGEEPTSGECAPADPERPDCTVNLVSAVVASKSADPASGTEVSQGREVTYTLTFENVSTDAGSTPVAIDYTDHLVGVLDDAALTEGPVSSDAGVTAVHDGDTIRVTGAVASGATVTVTYTVTVHDYDEQGDHLLGNVLAVTGEEPTCAPDSPLCTEHELVPPPALPVTGEGIAWIAVLSALTLLLLGGGAVMVSRRRERGEAA